MLAPFRPRPRVLANAVCDRLIRFGMGATWLVKAWGEWPFAQTRTYEIVAPSDDVAAMEGIRRFVAEMEAWYDRRGRL